jgi:hypothetical protein
MAQRHQQPAAQQIRQAGDAPHAGALSLGQAGVPSPLLARGSKALRLRAAQAGVCEGQ